ncbi:MAG: glycosyltransferase family 4 protein [Pseudomonadales bacterium]|nr:glycosyltransferase family 4 protein [Pseudomonadales bacterium]
MKLLLLIKGLGLGGAERHLVDVAVALQRQGNEVRVGYILAHKNALVGELEAADIEVKLLATKCWWLTSWLGYVRLIGNFRPVVVHAHLPVAGILARMIKPFFGYRLVYTEHNLFQRLYWVTRVVHRLTHSLDDLRISCSAPVAASLPWESTVVDNGVAIYPLNSLPTEKPSLRARLALSEKTVIFICVANMLKKKNHTLLLVAFEQAFSALLKTDNQAVALVLIGQDGTEREKLEHQASQLQTRKAIFFWGADAKAVDYLQQADVFCLASVFEGLPIALLESMAVGLAAIVTRTGAMPDVVEHGVSGLVVDQEDIVGYANALYALYTEPMRRQEMGRRAAQRVAQYYSQDAMLKKLLQCYAGDIESSNGHL